MKNNLSSSKSTFGNVYRQALKSQLKVIGGNLMLLREARRESIETVANAINLQPDVLESIENGLRDFKLNVLFNLCDYYHMSLEDLVKDSGMMQLKIA
jgi:hypothetical protein